MSSITVNKKSRKRQSKFEKLWDKAAKLKKQNARFEADLEAVVARMESAVWPKEAELAKQQIPLLQKLLTLGQRKSMTNWQRETLDEWIRELAGNTQEFNLINDELLDHIACYDAYRLGISLEDDSLPPHQQFAEAIKQAEERRSEAIKNEQEQRQNNIAEIRDQLIREAKQEVEAALNRLLGPEPAQKPSHSATADLWADELNSEEQRQQDAYREKRAAMQKQMLAEKVKEIDFMLDLDNELEDDDTADSDPFGDFDFSSFDEHFGHGFDSDDDPFQSAPNDALHSGRRQALSNEAFQHLFRATASKLHPDREPNPELRLEKQKLMADLLKARKKGDIMRVLELYETYVGTHEGFSKDDQKALTESLEKMIDELEDQQEEFIFQSPAHAAAYEIFYNKSKKKVDAAFSEYLKAVKMRQKVTAQQIANITSLKALKPELEERYQEMAFGAHPLEELFRHIEGR